MNPIAKISAAVFATGGTVAAGGYSWHLSKLSAISSLIEADEEVTLLTRDSPLEDWKEAWVAYKSEGNAWNLSNVSSENAPETFKDACLNQKNTKVKGTENNEFQNFKKWCSRNYTVSEWIEKSGLSLLNNQSESTKWNASWAKYKNDPRNKSEDKNNPVNKDIWETTDWDQKKSENAASEGFKNKCSEKSKLKVKNKKDETYLQVSSWCTSQL